MPKKAFHVLASSRLGAGLFLVLGICVAISIVEYRSNTQKEEDRTWWKDSSFKCVVVRKYVAKEEHNLMHTVLNDGSATGDYLWPEMYHKLDVGDSLFKESGRMDAVVKRPDGSTHTFSLFEE